MQEWTWTLNTTWTSDFRAVSTKLNGFVFFLEEEKSEEGREVEDKKEKETVQYTCTDKEVIWNWMYCYSTVTGLLKFIQFSKIGQ